MLTSLSIKNFALIEDIHLKLDDGFSIITGETGAGKSILLGALSLLLGKRADLSAIRDTSKKCSIEGEFNISAYNLERIFKEEDLDYETATIIRREILPSGKSRAFINDTPVKLNNLQVLGSHLVDIHSQNETLSLGQTDYQFFVLDTFADTQDDLLKYRKDLAQLKESRGLLEQAKANQLEANKAYDYNLFLLEELEKAQLKPGLLEELEQRQEQLSNTELLKEHIGTAINTLDAETYGILEQLRSVKRQLDAVANFSTSLTDLKERADSSLIELEDVGELLTQEFEDIEDDPKLLEDINAKLQVIYNLQKKHQAEDIETLLSIEEKLADEVSQTQSADDRIAALQNTVEDQTSKLKALANAITKKRASAIPQLLKSLQVLLSDLGMPDARFSIKLPDVERFTIFGTTDIIWLLSANKGGNLTDIKKAASGGELSRIMLSVKTLMAEKSKLPTLIFDEIDTGVSGDIANKMGDIMRAMGKHLQVLSITHLPQIAAKGKTHYKVYKDTQNKSTVTLIKRLDDQERIIEISEMLGGSAQTDATLQLAKSMLK